MNRRRLLSVMGVLVLLAACGGKDEPPPPPSPPPPTPPTVVSLTLKAAPDVNPDTGGTAKPLRVRILKLADGNALAGADFFALDRDPAKALGADLKGSDELILAPGAVQVWQAKLDDEVKVIGVVAAYHAIDRAQWRSWKEVPPHAVTLLVAELGASGVALREAAP
jgi:type VI secretion system protein VasD